VLLSLGEIALKVSNLGTFRPTEQINDDPADT